MRIEYNKEKIKTALRHFTQATGINVQFLKSDFSSLNISFPENRYCSLIQSSEMGQCGCLDSDKTLLRRCRESRRPETHVCHAGLVDVAVPIIYLDEIIGYLILGQMKENKPFEAIKGHIGRLSLDVEEMESLYEKLKLFDPEKIESVVIVAEMLAKYLLLQNTFIPRFDLGIHGALEYIHNNLDKPLTVEQISRQSGISKNTLYRGFQLEFHMTVGSYITEKRLEKAEDLLLFSDLSVEQVAETVGFSSASYFTACFKKSRGITPLHFRKNMYFFAKNR